MDVTIKDIAKRANVSCSTVSRVVANDSRISSETREKVLKIVKEMDYHPNYIARSLANRTTKTIGVIIPGTTEKAFRHPFYPEILSGIASVAHQNQYKMLLSTGVSDMKEEKEIIYEFARGKVTEGIILMTSRINDPSIQELKKMNFPFVLVGRAQEDEDLNWVDNDNISISYKLTQHLIDQGHRKIAFIGVSSDIIVTLDRLEGYTRALRDNNIGLLRELIVEGKFIDDTGFELMERLYKRKVRPTAVIAVDDFLAFGAIKFLMAQGLRVPTDLAVAGFNNVPLSDYFMPALTSVEINPFRLGVKSCELLLSSIKSNFKSFDRAIVPADLIVRSSTLKKS